MGHCYRSVDHIANNYENPTNLLKFEVQINLEKCVDRRFTTGEQLTNLTVAIKVEILSCKKNPKNDWFCAVPKINVMAIVMV